MALFHSQTRRHIIKYSKLFIKTMRGFRKLSQRGSNLDYVLFSWWRERGPKYHYKRAIITSETLNAGLVALWFYRGSRPVLLRNPIFLWFFRGVRTPCPPSLFARENELLKVHVIALLRCYMYTIETFETCQNFISFIIWTVKSLIFVAPKFGDF